MTCQLQHFLYSQSAALITHSQYQIKHLVILMIIREILPWHRDAAGISEADLAEGLRHMGYQLQEEEMALLTRHISSADEIPKATFLASQMDWHTFQEDYRRALVL